MLEVICLERARFCTLYKDCPKFEVREEEYSKMVHLLAVTYKILRYELQTWDIHIQRRGEQCGGYPALFLLELQMNYSRNGECQERNNSVVRNLG